MAKKQSSVPEVKSFLDNLHKIMANPQLIQINDLEWDNKINKTRQFMAEKGIKKTDVLDIVKELRVCNYSYTDDDVNPNYKDEEVWFFGITCYIVDTNYDLYIKLKTRKVNQLEVGIVMSFHPEQPAKKEDKLDFPYINNSV